MSVTSPYLHEIKRHRHTSPHLVLEAGAEDAGPYFITTGRVGIVLAAFGTMTDTPSIAGTHQQRDMYRLAQVTWAVAGLLEVATRAGVKKIAQVARRCVTGRYDSEAAFEREVYKRSAALFGREAA